MLITLEDALATGRGVERPFVCSVGDHTSPTASVNVVKQVWICYSCGAGGRVDSTRVPTTDELASMLEPERTARAYPESWLTTFGVGGYWAERFPLWLCWRYGLGEDPWTGEGTYPVHTAAGTLAGVARRALMEGPWPKYRYPSSWSVSRTLLGTRGSLTPLPFLVLLEGMADAMALRECGIPALGVGGSGLHLPQLELVQQMGPAVVLTGYDNDEAGQRATANDAPRLAEFAQTAAIDWQGAKDPAEMDVLDRELAVLNALSGMDVKASELVQQWAANKIRVMIDYSKETE